MDSGGAIGALIRNHSIDCAKNVSMNNTVIILQSLKK